MQSETATDSPLYVKAKISLALVVTSVLLILALMLTAASSARGSNMPEALSDMDCVLEPSLVVELGSTVPGLVDETFYDVGDYVTEGTLLAQLVDDVERLNLSIALTRAEDDTALRLRELAAQLGERTVERNATPGLGAAISAQTMDQVETEAAVARLQVLQEQRTLALAELEAERAAALLTQRRVVSPISGSIVHRYASSGEHIDGEPVYKIAQLDPLHVEVIVPVDYLEHLSVGSNAKVTIQAAGFLEQSLSAEVLRIDAVADAASATYGVRLLIDNPDLSIPSGVRCNVDFS